jgi:hypothetical protein
MGCVRGAILMRRLTLVTFVMLVFAAGTLILRRLIVSKGLAWMTDATTIGAFIVAVFALFAGSSGSGGPVPSPRRS